MISTQTDSVSVVLPVYNQADHLERMVQRYVSSLAPCHCFEILLVENGSTDGSRPIVEWLVEQHGGSVRGVFLNASGWGRAVVEGLRQSRGSWLCFTNSARTPPEELPGWIAQARSHPNAVTKVTRVQRSGIRRAGSLLYNLENRLLHGVRSCDVNGTPKIFSRGTLEQLRLSETGNLLDLQVLQQCARHGIAVHEISAPFPARLGGVSTTTWRAALGMYAGSVGLWRRGWGS